MPSDKSKKAYDLSRAGTRTRNWCVIFYPDDLPDDWKNQVDEMHVRWIEGPIHDNDFNPDGQPKKLHVHTLFMFDVVKNREQVKEIFVDLFGVSETGAIVGVASPEACRDRSGAVRYMAHLDNPQKAQYDVADIVGHNGADPAEIIRYSVTEALNKMTEMEEFIEDNGITELSDFSRAIRYTHPDWYQILTTKSTFYFNSFISSVRHKLK